MQELGARHAGDPILAELVGASRDDGETLALVFRGPRACRPHGDGDLIRVVTDSAHRARRSAGSLSERWTLASTRTVRVVHVRLADVERHARSPGALTATYLYGTVVYDAEGGVARLIERMAATAGEHARASVPMARDRYRDAMLRSVGAARRHDQLGQRLQAAESAAALVELLFGLESCWPPPLDDLGHELASVEHAQAWPSGYLRWALLQLLRDPAPRRQLELERRVRRVLDERHVAHDWHEPMPAGMPAAVNGHMSDARQSPIPQDRVAENIDQRQRAHESKHEQRQRERYLEEQGVDERPGTNPQQQPGIPSEPTGPAEGGD